MATQLLRRLKKVLQEWPVDSSRKGRDLGEFLRDSYVKQYKDLINTDPVKANNSIDSLEKLNSNYYYCMYPRKYNYSYSQEVVINNSWILSNKTMNEMNNRRSLWKRLRRN